MWIIDAIGSAVFAGVTSVLAKVGMKKTDSTLATAIRTLVVLIFSWAIVFATGVGGEIIQGRTLFFLVLSGVSTGASWLCYYRAIRIGEINKVVPVDKASTVLTVLFAVLFLKERITWYGIVGLLGISLGVLLMVPQERTRRLFGVKRRGWLFFAVGSAVFAALTAIFGKIGVAGVNSDYATALRTDVVAVTAWAMVFIERKQSTIKALELRELIFICLSGIATGVSWLCYYRALQTGPASGVVPIDKLSILFTCAFSRIFLKERLTKRAFFGLLLVTAGTLLLIC